MVSESGFKTWRKIKNFIWNIDTNFYPTRVGFIPEELRLQKTSTQKWTKQKSWLEMLNQHQVNKVNLLAKNEILFLKQISNSDHWI